MQTNFLEYERLERNEQYAVKNIDILGSSLSVYNCFDSLIKLFLNLSTHRKKNCIFKY